MMNAPPDETGHSPFGHKRIVDNRSIPHSDSILILPQYKLDLFITNIHQNPHHHPKKNTNNNSQLYKKHNKPTIKT